MVTRSNGNECKREGDCKQGLCKREVTRTSVNEREGVNERGCKREVTVTSVNETETVNEARGYRSPISMTSISIDLICGILSR